jgi:hypothetical protein
LGKEEVIFVSFEPLLGELSIVVCEVLDILILPLLPVKVIVGLPELGKQSGCLLVCDVGVDEAGLVLVVGRCCKVRAVQERGVNVSLGIESRRCCLF